MSETTVDPGTEAPPAEPAAEPAAEPVANGADDWRADIKDEKLRDHAGRFTSIDALVEANLNYRKDFSKAIMPLAEDATDEQVATYRKATGIPETAEGYEFSVPEGHELTEADKAFQASAAEKFHSLNIPAEAAKGLNEWYNEVAAATLQAQIDDDKKYADETEAALKKEWPGEEFNRNKAFADHAASRLFGDELDEVRNVETKDGRFVLDHPAFVKMLAQYGREMQEGRMGDVMTESARNDLQGQIDDLEKQIDKATMEGDREKANELYIQQQELYRKSYGAGPVVGAEGRVA